jgi:uncharacterized membrane protein YdjX (TVP38/TMEM64 family)
MIFSPGLALDDRRSSRPPGFANRKCFYALRTISSPGKVAFLSSSACGLSSLVFRIFCCYTTPMISPRRRLAIRGAIFIVLVGLLFFFSHYIPQPFTALMPPGEDFDDFEGIYSSSDKLSKFLQSLGPYSPAVFVLLQILQVVAAPFPGELTGVAGGYVYGETMGFVLSMVGLAIGSWVAFELASILGRPFVERFVSQEVLQKFDFLTTNAGVVICFLLFLIPGFPKDYLCYLLGLSRMKLSTFLIVSIIGRIPGTYLLTVQGAKFRSQEYYAVAIFAAISAVILLLAYLYRNQLYDWLKHRHDR